MEYSQVAGDRLEGRHGNGADAESHQFQLAYPQSLEDARLECVHGRSLADDEGRDDPGVVAGGREGRDGAVAGALHQEDHCVVGVGVAARLLARTDGLRVRAAPRA